MRNVIVGLAVLAAISGSTSLSAAPLAYDGFGDYTAGQYLAGTYTTWHPWGWDMGQAALSGGAGFSGAWTSDYKDGTNYLVSMTTSPTYTSGSLSLATQAGYATSNSGYNPQAGRTFDTSVTSATGVAGTTVYTSFLMSAPNVWESVGTFELYNGTTSVLKIGRTWASGATTGANADGNEHFYVLKLAYDNGGNVAQTLFVDPSLAAEPSTGGIDLGTKTAYQFDSYKLTAAYNLPLVFDELRVGTTYGDVTPVPEPAVIGLAALGSMMFAARRRRQ